MNEAIRALEPQTLWNYFADLNAIPRASKKEQHIAAFVKEFGEKLGLETQLDENLNVLIKKQATAGMESRQTIVLQSHLDMVHQKNSDVQFDFDNQGIDMYVEGDWVKARGTTLGADNGIGVASILTLLASSDIPHPAIEALLTIDEETGMTGAKTLHPDWLSGKILLNLDTEDDDELTIGCAGGIDITASGTYPVVHHEGMKCYQVSVKGLTGGHSGVDIHLGRANANKLMNRILFALTQKAHIYICSIQGGSLRNAIPRESVAIFKANDADKSRIEEVINQLTDICKGEFSATDPNLNIEWHEVAGEHECADNGFIQTFLRCIYACPDGIYRMTPGIEGLVQSSNNISKVTLADGKFQVQNLTRSSVDSEKMDLAQSISAAMELCGATMELDGEYPGWKPEPEAPIIRVMSDLYQELFHENAHVNAIHAGLECGIIGAHYPGMQMISFGPNIYGPHSPDERVQISSVQKFWKFLLEILKRIPEKAAV